MSLIAEFEKSEEPPSSMAGLTALGGGKASNGPLHATQAAYSENESPAKMSEQTSKKTRANLARPVISWAQRLIRKEKPQNSLQDVIGKFIGETTSTDETEPASPHERAIFTNVARLRGMTVLDVMIPRADIVAIDISTSQKDLFLLLAEKQFSRIPVYRETLDDVIGTIHIKDIMAAMAQGITVDITSLVRDVPIVSPAMPVIDLILMMKHARKHMAMVIDEYGGIDGLVTIGDVIEAIIGEIEDEHGIEEQPQFIENADGSIIVDARIDIDTLEARCGKLLSDDEREDIDTLGGLLFALSGRIPGRGEIISHPAGLIFEVIDADPRRVNKVLLRNIPLPYTRN